MADVSGIVSVGSRMPTTSNVLAAQRHDVADRGVELAGQVGAQHGHVVALVGGR